MHCIVDHKEEEEDKQHIVKRRFVPITFRVENEGQFLNAEAKLPFTANKVIGVLTCAKVYPCEDTPQTPRYYFGITDEKMVDDRFLNDSNGIEYTTDYPPTLSLEPVENKYWYYVHRVSDVLPSFIFDGAFQDLGDPIPIAIKKQGQCEAEPHYLWSAKFSVDTVIVGFYFPA